MLFWGPIAVAVDAEDRVFMVESARHRIQVYQKQSPVFFGGRLLSCIIAFKRAMYLYLSIKQQIIAN